MKNGASSKAQGRERPGAVAGGWVAASHVWALWTFAVAQPILDLIGREPDFLVAQRLTGAPLLAGLALGATLGIPALLTSPLVIPGIRGSRAGRLWIDGVRMLLAGAFALQLMHRLPAVVALVLSLAAGTALVICLNRYRAFSNAVAIGAATAVIAPLVFLLRPGVRGLLPTVSATHFEPDPVIAAAPAVQTDLPIVLVVFDELPTSSLQLPDGSIDSRRFPSFAALAEDSDWYVHAVTAGLQTSKAIPALLTGRLPQPDSIAHYREHTSNLFSWLGSRGDYDVVAHETVTQLCPPAICARPTPSPWARLTGAADDLAVVYGHLLLPPDLRTGLPSVSHTWTGFRDARSNGPLGESRPERGGLYQDVPQLLDDFLQRIGERSRRAPFYYLHLNLPHRPWKYLPSGREYAPAGSPISAAGFNGRSLPDDEWLTIQGLQRHLLQVGYADRVLGQVLDRLKETGIYDRALVVVLADHGHSFRPGQRLRAATDANAEDVLEVPLFIKHPGQTTGASLHHTVQTIDIVPTIAEAIGVRPPWSVDGRPVSDRSPRNIKVCCYNESPAARSFDTDAVRRRQTLERLDRLFGTGREAQSSEDPFRGVFAAGPRPDLLGRQVADLASSNATEGEPVAASTRAMLSTPAAFQDVQPETGFVPSLVTGRIEPRVADDTPLAISVDGTVRATTMTFTERGASRFSALIEERWLQVGNRRIGVYEIHGGPPLEEQEQTVLTALLSGGRPPRLVAEFGRVRGVDLAGDGFLEGGDHLFQSHVELPGGGFQVLLTSRPGKPLRPADEFFVFDGSALLYRGPDDRTRRRRRQLEDQREEMTFRISLPATVLDKNSLSLLARRGDRVQQLYPRPQATYELVRSAPGPDVLLRRPRNAAHAEPERIPIERRSAEIIGSVGGWTPDRKRIHGWAADLKDLGSHQEVVAFLSGREIWAGETGRRREDAAERAGHSYSGFGLPDDRFATSDRPQGPTADELSGIEREGVVVYAISHRDVAVRLPFAYRALERTSDGAELLVVSDGRRLPVRPPGDGFDGAVDLVTKPAAHTLIEGWAADVRRSERPRQIVIYRDGEFLAAMGANRERPDVAEHYGDERLLRTGFRGRVPGGPDPATLAERHRVFAVMLRGVAVELPIEP
ncbi:MAG: sulfatase-like hydrolase/transferase [Holophagales bacterium]|nr:sulfatase-like hydrolase/transferase [Holophagales bacterium]MYD21126.1 sulfatase-like hydrolase/transferase [Holophagales bacterium]MYI34437.1 sulfatase-like hydrolase/transferase [Holophagales bacterium]